uniref:Uncharacterized protein n=1 Tax=Siphoviridae sp. cttFh17 TaxID=2826491 RepID=A0A8S5NI73_9CAUD|nr:MAG TPA: hypothetical protein [Siphoviridae sp. cttFh17]
MHIYRTHRSSLTSSSSHNNYFFLYSLSKSFNLQRLRNHLYLGVTVKSFLFNII